MPHSGEILRLLEQTRHLNTALNQNYLTFEPEPRIVALLKEHTTHAKVLDDAKREAREYSRALQNLRKDSALYGEDVPVSLDLLSNYVLNRIGELSAKADPSNTDIIGELYPLI